MGSLMTYPLVIEDASFEDLISDSDHFVKLFRESKLLIFPELHLSEEQNSQVREAFGYGYYGHHDETHRFALSQNVEEAGPQDQLVSWHLEDPDGILEIYKKMAAGETEILQHPTQEFRHGMSRETPVRKAAIPHPLTGELTLRYMPDFNYLVLPEFHEQRKVADAAVKELINDPDNQVWWEWTKGDYVFADLVVTCHSVKGGFVDGERVLDVAFGMIGNYPKHLREQWQPGDPRLLPENAVGGGVSRGTDGVAR